MCAFARCRTCDLFGDDEKKPESQPAIPAAAVHGSALNGSDKAAAADEKAAAAAGRGGRGGAVGKPRSDFALPCMYEREASSVHLAFECKLWLERS